MEPDITKEEWVSVEVGYARNGEIDRASLLYRHHANPHGSAMFFAQEFHRGYHSNQTDWDRRNSPTQLFTLPYTDGMAFYHEVIARLQERT